MRYTYITDLPPQVRETLAVDKQELWMGAFNEAMTTAGSEEEAYRAAWAQVMGVAYEGEIPTATPDESISETVTTSNSTNGTTINVNIQADEDSPKYSYLSELANLKFEDDTPLGRWIQAMPTGTYDHPIYGEIDITPDRVRRFAQNVNTYVRGQQLDVDFEHKEGVDGGRAAGWITKAQAKDDGLYIYVEFTPRAATEIKNGEWKYFSPEFQDKWCHPKTKKCYNDVLFGGALTNRPFLKDIMPINFSEVWEQSTAGTTEKEEESMEELVAKLREALGLKEDASEEDILGKIKTLSEEKVTPPTTQEEERVRKFSEDYPDEYQKMIELQNASKLTEVNSKIESWTAKGLAPVVHDDLREFRLGLDGDKASKFDELFSKVVDKGLVELDEKGNTQDVEDSTEPAVRLDAIARKLMEENKSDYRTALAEAQRQNPELARELIRIPEGG